MRKVFLVLLIITVVLTGCQKNEFTPNENLPYQGDVENGMKQGEGTMSYDNGNVFYEGQWKEDKFNGEGKLYYEDGTLRYEGEFKDNLMHGNGKVYSEAGDLVYDGQWLENEMREKVRCTMIMEPLCTRVKWLKVKLMVMDYSIMKLES